MQLFRRQNIATQRLDQGCEQATHSGYRVGHSHTVQLDAIMRIHLRLPIEWKVPGILRYDELRQQTWGQYAAINRAGWRPHLHNMGTAGAVVFGLT